jgi:hypothetical protein
MDAKNSKMKKVKLLLILTLLSLFAQGHVGSPGVQMYGTAGPYRVMVSVEPPAVIPGTAKVTVFAENESIIRILGRPIFFRSGTQGAPSSDELTKVKGQNGQFQGEIWFMEGGSSSVQLEIFGPEGKGELVVPVAAVSTAQREMPKGLGIGLAFLGVLLLLLMVTTIGASVSDATLRPGEVLSIQQRKKRWIQMGIATTICTVILYVGSSWWDSWAANFSRHLYKPMTGTGTVVLDEGQRKIQLSIDSSNWTGNRKSNSLHMLIPDHGKIMHVFLVRSPGLDAFAHLHPERVDSTSFEAFLPDLPAGNYLMYADIVNYSGFAETIVTSLNIPPLPAGQRSTKTTAAEDAYVITDPLDAPGKVLMDENVVICGKPGTKTVFTDGSYAVWEGKPDKPLESGKAYSLNFEIFNPDGSVCIPEPYLGMQGHLAVFRSDGSVYIHLHPTGTFAMAAVQLFNKRLNDTASVAQKPKATAFRDSVDHYLNKLSAMTTTDREQFLMTEMGMYNTSDAGTMTMEHGNRISFPYSFPKEGRYRLFLQIKRNEKVLTGVFDVIVKDPLSL